MTNKINIVISSPPFSRIDGKEALDLALVCAAFEQPVALFFVGAGVFHLIEAQHAESFDDKLHDKQIKALPYYDIDEIYVESESLAHFALSMEQLLESVVSIDSQQIAARLAAGQHQLIF